MGNYYINLINLMWRWS